MLIYTFIVTQTKYGQGNSDLTDIHDFTCIIDGTTDNELSLKSALRKFIIESPCHIDKFLWSTSSVSLNKLQSIHEKISNHYHEMSERDEDFDEKFYKKMAEQYVEDLIKIYHNFAKEDNYRYLKYTCIPVMV